MTEFRQNHLLNEDGACIVHTFSTPVEGKPHARQCRFCAEPQVYRPPTGGGRDPFVMVDEADLRELIECYRGQAAMPDERAKALCDRLESLLTSG